MMQRHLDGWDIDVQEDADAPFPIRVVATHVTGSGECSSGRDLESALLDLARKIHVDRRELLLLYHCDE